MYPAFASGIKCQLVMTLMAVDLDELLNGKPTKWILRIAGTFSVINDSDHF